MTAFLRSGAIAGVVSALVFTAIHDLVISDIWATLPMMMIAGALCGLSLGWTFTLLWARPGLKDWGLYNLTFTMLFVLLGVTSELVFDPITHMAVVVAANEPPNELIAKAFPMTAAFTLAGAAVVVLLFGRAWRNYLPVLVTFSLLVLTLGLNVSAIGLVEIPGSSLYAIAELFGLIVVLSLVYAVVFAALERKKLRRVATSPAV